MADMVRRKNRVHPTNNFIEFRAEEIEQSVPDRFEQQVRQHSDRLAVRGRQEQLTYDELNKSANRLAQSILKQYGHSEEPVALLFEHGISIVIAMLGALKAGKIYVPLDPAYPHTRLDYMLQDLQTGLIVTNDKNIPLAKELAGNQCQLMNIDRLDTRISDENPNLSIPPEAFVNIYYTSGSTGQPKGVVHNHRNLLYNCMRNTNDFHICWDDRLTFITSCSFGASLSDIFPSILNGACLFPFDLKAEGLDGLAEWMVHEGITICQFLPTVFRHFVSTLSGEEDLSKLRLIRMTGESVRKQDVELYKRHFSPKCLLVNSWGATETSLFRPYFIDKDTEINGNNVPIGYADENKEILLLDSEGEKVGPNQIGEIVVRSRYLAPEYWRLPDHTQATFLPDPHGGPERIYHIGDTGLVLPNGCLIHLGRKDFQMKIRGYRIEVSEIEAALLRLENVKEVAVVARDNEHNEQYLVAYIVPAEEPAPTITALHRFLARDLPDYMIPSAFVALDELPLTATGKLNRLALPAPDMTRPKLGVEFVAPRDKLESKLARIWEEILGMDSIGVRDSFLELGGNSILAARLFSQIRKMSGQELGLSTILHLPTIEKQASLIRQTHKVSAYPLLIAIQTGGARIPLFAVHACDGEILFYRDLAHHLGPEQPFYALRLHGIHGKEVPHDTIEDMAEQYVREIQVIQSEGPYLLCGFGVGGRIAFEMAQQLVSQEEEIGLLTLMDSAPPDHITLDSGPSIHRRSVGYYPHRLLYHLRHGQLLHVLMARTKRIRTNAKNWITWITLDPQERRMKDASETLMRVAGAYAPQVYPGRIVYFSSDARGDRSPVDRWRELARDGLDVQEVPGYHDGMLREPHVQGLAKRLQVLLRK